MFFVLCFSGSLVSNLPVKLEHIFYLFVCLLLVFCIYFTYSTVQKGRWRNKTWDLMHFLSIKQAGQIFFFFYCGVEPGSPGPPIGRADRHCCSTANKSFLKSVKRKVKQINVQESLQCCSFFFFLIENAAIFNHNSHCLALAGLKVTSSFPSLSTSGFVIF